MAKIKISAETDIPADVVLGAIIDFSERRPTLWPNIDPGIYQVHGLGEDWADVTEGSSVVGGVWAHERYDWSTPGVVRATTQDSNIFKSGFWEMRVSDADGRTHIEILQDRQAKGLKGHLLGAMMSLMGARAYRQQLAATLAILRAEPSRETA